MYYYFFLKNLLVSLVLMSVNKIYLLIDAGNTRIKVAEYHDEALKKSWHFTLDQLKDLLALLREATYDHALLSSVIAPKVTLKIEAELHDYVNLKQVKLPIHLAYETSDTLGADRIANAVAANYLAHGNALSIDIGTCVKFDFIDVNKNYLGGSISPGIKLRYKSLNDYTASLPLLNERTKSDVIGTNTNLSIQSGVLFGIQGEIDFFIKQYEQRYPDLTIFVTGGDAVHFDYSLKNNIFANENLTLLGLLLILKSNVR